MLHMAWSTGNLARRRWLNRKAYFCTSVAPCCLEKIEDSDVPWALLRGYGDGKKAGEPTEVWNQDKEAAVCRSQWSGPDNQF